MMKLWMAVLCIIIVGIASAAGVFAYTVNEGDLIVLQNGPGTTGGGEFRVFDDSGTYLFNTFCLETNEYISFGTPYRVDSITTTAINGGSGGPKPDPLDEKTAFLYYNFATGNLTGYDYSDSGYGLVNSANDLQKAIWYIEGETLGEYNYFVDMAKTATDPGGEWYGLGLGNVRVMNLVDQYRSCSLKQSQLILVPEPGTLLLLGAGLIGVGLLRKRFKR
jgi:hypothetical protein